METETKNRSDYTLAHMNMYPLFIPTANKMPPNNIYIDFMQFEIGLYRSVKINRQFKLFKMILLLFLGSGSDSGLVANAILKFSAV